MQSIFKILLKSNLYYLQIQIRKSNFFGFYWYESTKIQINTINTQ